MSIKTSILIDGGYLREILNRKRGHRYYPKPEDGINESVPDVILNDVLIEDLEFQPDFDGDKEQCRKKENSRNLGKCSK